jgi:hypothetical protein
MHIEVDQSVKIENTRADTVLAFADGESYAILIPAAVKRLCLVALRERRKLARIRVIRLFSAALFLLMEPHWNRIREVTIDIEYTGWEADIKAALVRHLRAKGLYMPEYGIHFRRIGKKSPAHKLALLVYRGGAEPNRRIAAEELLRLVA